MESIVTYMLKFSICYNITMPVLLINKDIVLFSLPLSVFAVCYVVVENAQFYHKEMQQFNHGIDFTLKFKL